MNQQKRLLAFWLSTIVIFFVWAKLAQWRQPPRPANQAKVADKADGDKPAPDKKRDDTSVKPGAAEIKPAKADPPRPAEKPVDRRDDIMLGGDDATLTATFSNTGGVITHLQLNAFKNEKRDGPFVLLGAAPLASYVLTIKGDHDGPDDPEGVQNKNWEVVEAKPAKVVFRTKAMDGNLQIEKRFTLSDHGYAIDLELIFVNLTKEPLADVVYTLTGGAGLPVEGSWYTTYHRKMAVVLAPKFGDPYYDERTIQQINGDYKKDRATEYTEIPVQFGGIAVQYFASVVAQTENPQQARRFASIRATVVDDAKDENLHNIGVQFASVPMTIPAAGQQNLSLVLFNGPKKREVVDSFSELQFPLLIHYYNTFYLPVGPIAKLMATVLNWFYEVVHDYGVAIILLTLVVRCCMFPLSFRQNLMMQKNTEKMKILQPKMDEVKKKYANDPKKLNTALWELQKEHGVNPAGGCLMAIVQLPIFIGLYQSIITSFDLRQSTCFYGFTWIKDLVAPDQLFAFGFRVPGLGPVFNLLPFVSLAQMMIQMHYTTPATTPEAQQQKKVFMFVMLFMSLMFYNFPAGLCVYFITNGLMGLLERKLLPKKPQDADGAAATAATAAATLAAGGNGVSWKTAVDPKKKGKSRR